MLAAILASYLNSILIREYDNSEPLLPTNSSQGHRRNEIIADVRQVHSPITRLLDQCCQSCAMYIDYENELKC